MTLGCASGVVVTAFKYHNELVADTSGSVVICYRAMVTTQREQLSTFLFHLTKRKMVRCYKHPNICQRFSVLVIIVTVETLK